MPDAVALRAFADRDRGEREMNARRRGSSRWRALCTQRLRTAKTSDALGFMHNKSMFRNMENYSIILLLRGLTLLRELAAAACHCCPPPHRLPVVRSGVQGVDGRTRGDGGQCCIAVARTRGAARAPGGRGGGWCGTQPCHGAAASAVLRAGAKGLRFTITKSRPRKMWRGRVAHVVR